MSDAGSAQVEAMVAALASTRRAWRLCILLPLLLLLPACVARPPRTSAPERPRGISRVTEEELVRALRLPAPLEPLRRPLALAVLDAHGVIGGFAASQGWEARMGLFFPNGVEVFASQKDLWQRILALNHQPRTLPIPSAGLSAALEQGVLLAVSPEEYARVAPQYARFSGSYTRLLAHEIAHRLHIAVLDGREDAMGPVWFYEGLAVVAAGDLPSPALSLDDAWKYVGARGTGAYRKYAAALRAFMACTPLPNLVQHAGREDFEAWLRVRCPAEEEALTPVGGVSPGGRGSRCPDGGGGPPARP